MPENMTGKRAKLGLGVLKSQDGRGCRNLLRG